MSGIKEDGELSDGEIDEEVQRETAEMGNGENLPEPAVPRPHSAPATAPSAFDYRESRENVANNSDFGSSDNDSDSDSDNDKSWKRMRPMPSSTKPVAPHRPVPEQASSYMRPVSVKRETTATASHATDYHSLSRSDHRRTKSLVSTTSKKRKNNIWGAVLTEQTAERVEKEMTEFDMDTEMDRDVESYNYRMALEEAPRHKLGMSAGRMEMEDGASSGHKRKLDAGLGEDEGDKWLVDKAENNEIEERGDVKDRLGYKNVKDRLGLDAEIQEESREDEMERKKQREYRFGKRSSAKHRLGHKVDGGSSSDPSTKMKPITFGDNEQDKEVAGKIAFSLDEPKRDLIVRVVDILGVDKVKELWQQTWDVEQSGGMLIMSGNRRRLPGGVFLQLMKTDEDVTKDQVNEVFAEEKKKDAKREKEHRKRKRRQQAHGTNYESYLKETKEILAEKRQQEKESSNNKDMDLDIEEGQLDSMDEAAMVTKRQDDERTDSMESGDATAMAV